MVEVTYPSPTSSLFSVMLPSHSFGDTSAIEDTLLSINSPPGIPLPVAEGWIKGGGVGDEVDPFREGN